MKCWICLLLLLTGLAAAEPGPVPFTFDWSKVGESRIDLSRFLDGPAGKAGPVRAEGERLVTGDGRPIRFWGVNLAINICFAPKEEAAHIADDLARWGINMVRFHHVDTDWGRSLIDLGRDDTRHFNAGDLDRFDKLVAELKKRGIWTALTMNIHRKFKQGDGVRDWQALGIGKGASYFNPRLVELQHEFARGFLGHKNPYTGLSYAEDPAVALIELLNENSLVEAWAAGRLGHGFSGPGGPTWQPVPDSYATELDGLYYDWLLVAGTPAERQAVTRETGISFATRPDPVPPTLRLLPDQFGGAGRERFHAEARFLMSVEAGFFDAYRKLIREELGSRALLTLSNDHNDRISGYPHLAGNLRGDWIDGHGYWQHPNIGEVTSTANTPMVNDPLDCTVVQYARSVVKGRPFTIGETNHPFPHRHAAEGYPILAAYAQLQGWSAINWFDWEQGRLAPAGQGIKPNGWFDLSNDSMKLAQLATCALMWHRGDVAPSGRVHLRRYTAGETRESLRLFDEPPFFKPGFDISLPLRQAVRFTFDPDAEASPLDLPGTPRRPWDSPPAEILSDTGQLAWSHADSHRGIVRIDTPKTCGLVGFVKDHWWKPAATTVHLAAEPELAQCSILLTSLDDREIATSGRLLLTAAGRNANTGQAWRDDLQTLAEWGGGPLTIVPVAGSVTLKGLSGAKAVKAHPLSPEGCRGEVATDAARTAAGWRLELDQPTTWWELEVVR